MGPDGFVVALLLLAAALHAGWNAIAKSASDPLLAIGLVTFSGGVFAAVAIPFVAFPSRDALPYLAGSLVLHLVYQLSLAFAYRRGDLSHVYPIARGVAPCVAVGIAAATGTEIPTSRDAAGLALVAVSIGGLAFAAGSRPTSPALMAAIATGLQIGLYTFVDAMAVRRVNDPFDFIVWSFVLDGIAIALVVVALRADSVRGVSRAQLQMGVAGGLMGVVAYGIVLWALASASIATAAAAREASVVFAAVIGVRLLGEPFGARRIWASGGVATGIALLAT